MRIRWLILVVLLSCPAFALQINEIMFNPQGSDTGREWVELYNNDSETYNISEWKLVTDNTNHNLNTNDSTELFYNDSYIVLVQDIAGFLSDYPLFSGQIIDSSWSDLSNSANETFVIKNASFVFDNITYSSGAEGKSLCKNDSFFECDPTPGMINMIIVNQSNITQQNQSNITGYCDISASVYAFPVFSSNDTVSFETTLAGINCTDSSVEYWIEDLFGNVVKNTVNTSQSCSAVPRQWSPSDVDGSEAYSIKLVAYPSCNDTNSSNNIASATIIVKGAAKSNVSWINITQAKNGTFGESISIDVDIYRGATAKYAVSAYVRDSSGNKISDTSSIHVFSKYVTYSFSVPVQIKTYCSGERPDGVYTVVVEGLDASSEAQITVKNPSSNCKTITIQSSSGSGSSAYVPVVSKEPVYTITYPDSVFAGDEFETVIKFNSTVKKSFSFYSYVYKGNMPVSQGFNGTSWKGTWNSNTQNMLTEPGKTYVVVLKSRIENETQSGMYSLRVRIKSDKEEDVTKEIEIKRKDVAVTKLTEVVEKTVINNSFNTTKTDISYAKITGLSVKKSFAHEIVPLLSFILRMKKLL